MVRFELAERETRAAAEAQDLQFLSARLTRVETAFECHRLAAVYQPIVDLGTGATCGHEALSGFQLDPLRPPDQWIAEGFETAEEMQTLTALGVECAQGYYLGAP
jgi:EAL domain-containing protein (putative c-di-GMP-specific phosphodiesterase class I)